MSTSGLITRGLDVSIAEVITAGLSSASPQAVLQSGITFLQSLLELELDDQTYCFAHAGTSMKATGKYYVPLLISISPINREIPIQPGLYSTGNVEVVLANTGRFFSQLRALGPWRNRVARILFGWPDLGYSSYEPAWTGVIADSSINDRGECHITLADKWLDRFEMPVTVGLPQLVPGGYPDAVPDYSKPYLIPWVMGTHQSFTTVSQGGGQLTTQREGVLPAYLINPTTHTYVLGVGFCEPAKVYVYGVEATQSVMWFGVTIITPSGGETMSTISFVSDPRDPTRPTDELEVTWTGTGHSQDLADDFNPLSELQQFLLSRGKIGTSDVFDVESWATAIAAMSARGYIGAWAVIDADMTIAEVVENFSKSYACRFYWTRAGKLAVNFIGESRSIKAAFSGGKEITDKTFQVSMNPGDSTASRLQVNFDWNYVREFYHRQPDINSPEEEVNLGVEIRKNASLIYARSLNADNSGPLNIGSLLLSLMKEDLQIVEFEVPARFFSLFDLGDPNSITHKDGVGANGYEGVRMIVTSTGLTASPDGGILQVKGYVQAAPPVVTVEMSAAFTLEGGLVGVGSDMELA